MMRVAVIVVAWNGETLLPAALASLELQDPVPDLVIVDNGSSDRTADVSRRAGRRWKARRGAFRLVSPGRNLGFTLGANAGMEAALALDPAPEVLVLLNQDATLEPEALAAIVTRFGTEPRTAAVGPLILYPDGKTVQHAGGFLDPVRGSGRHAGHHEPIESVLSSKREPDPDPDFLTGAILALRSAALLEVGLFDAVFSPGYYEDVDLCRRLRAAGWSIRFEPAARGRHQESASFADRSDRFRLSERNRFLFLLPRMVGEEFRDELAVAEREAWTTLHPDLVEAIAGGAFGAVLSLPEFSRERLPMAERSEIVRFLLAIRRDAFSRRLAIFR